MKRIVALAFLAIAFAAPPAMAQATPEATLSRFVELANAGKLATPEGRSLLTGELKDMANSTKAGLPAADKIVMISTDHAVARFVICGPAGRESDAYFYLDRTPQGWALSAYRNMAQTGMLETLLAELKKRASLSVEEQYQKRNLELTLSSDHQLRDWFGAHRAELDRSVTISNSEDLKALLALGLQSYDNSGGDFRIIIGGMTDNTVGLLKPGPAGPPAISPSDHIWVEDLGGGWFLFRTT